MVEYGGVWWSIVEYGRVWQSTAEYGRVLAGYGIRASFPASKLQAGNHYGDKANT